jgi:hypothetical protein
MGSYVSIGFVYGINKCENFVYDNLIKDTVEQELKKLIDYFLSINGTIKKIEYSEDLEGENWTEINSSSLFYSKDIYQNIVNGYYGEITIHSDILEGRDVDCIIRLEKQKEFFGFLLDIKEEDILRTHSKEEIRYVTEELIATIIRVYQYSNYNYAFCDQEAEFSYAPEEFSELEEIIYSVAVIPNPNANNFTIIKGNWNIDGLTNREKYGKEVRSA